MILPSRIISVLSPHHRSLFFMTMLLMIVSGILEMASVFVLMDFFTLLMGQESTAQTKLHHFLSVLPHPAEISPLLFSGSIALSVLVLSGISGSLMTWTLLRFTWAEGQELSIRLLETFLGLPFQSMASRSTSGMLKTIFTEVVRVVGNVMIPAATIVSRGFFALMILVSMMLVNTTAAVSVLAVLGGAYTIIYLSFRRWLSQAASQAANARTDAFRIAAESLDGGREIRLFGCSSRVLDHFIPVSRNIATLEARNQLLSQLPRYILETIAFGGLIIGSVATSLEPQGEQTGTILPLLATFAFAGYRLMPALQQLYAAAVGLRGNIVSLDILASELALAPAVPPVTGQLPAPVSRLRLDNVSFRYHQDSPPPLASVSLSIVSGEAVAIVGETGSGKSTLLDIISGLAEPGSGQILLDDLPLRPETVSSWQRQIGYVPQHTFLLDDTIEANIAFGIPPSMIDRERIREAARLACADDFIQKLPAGYQTVIGEKGGKLSGGQRQRISLARALYRQPGLLVLDEATSALDEQTERRLVSSLQAIKGRMMILVISHRPEILSLCDRVLELSGGKLSEYQQKS